MKKRKLLPVLLALAMVLTMIPASVFADVPGEFSPVEANRLSTALVEGVKAEVTKGSIVFTVNSKADTSNWDQNSGDGSVDTYTYVGLYVEMPEGAKSLKMNGEGNKDEMTQVTDAFLQGEKYQHWIPVAEKNNDGSYSLFWGNREYTILLEWFDENGESLEKEYVKVTRNLSEDLAVAQVKNGYTYETLEGALAAAEEGDTVTLLQDVDVDKMLVINKTGLILDLNGHKITGSDEFTGTGNDAHVVDITADGVMVENGTIAAGAKNNHTLNIWNAKGVELFGLTLDGSKAGIGGAPLIVGASEVNLGGEMKFITGENSWYAMNIDSRNVSGTATPAKVTVLEKANLTFEGTKPVGIYIENTANVDKDQIGIEFKEGVTFNSDISGFVALATAEGVEAAVVNPENAGLTVDEDGNYIIAEEVTETPDGTNPDGTDQEKADSPKTSDDFNMAIPFAAAGLALAAMAAVVATRKRHN